MAKFEVLESIFILDGTADAAIANFHPLSDFLAALVDSQRFFDIRCCDRV